MTRRITRLLAAAAVVMALACPPASAAPTPPPTPDRPAVGPVFAGYWGDFVDHWGDKLRKQNGVVVVALLVGVVSLIIITRGKWMK